MKIKFDIEIDASKEEIEQIKKDVMDFIRKRKQRIPIIEPKTIDSFKF